MSTIPEEWQKLDEARPVRTGLVFYAKKSRLGPASRRTSAVCHVLLLHLDLVTSVGCLTRRWLVKVSIINNIICIGTLDWFMPD